MTEFTDLANKLEASQHLAAIIESSQDAIISKNLDGVILSWNPAAAKIFGYTAEEIVGKSVLTLIPEDRTHEEALILNKIRNGERIEHYETLRKRKDGSFVDISVTISPIFDQEGRVVGASKIARDMSGRKRADKIAQHFSAIIESSEDAIVSKDLNGIIQSWNKSAERMFGYTSDEIIGQPVLVLIPTDRRHEEDIILGRIRQGHRIEHFETVRQHKDGSLLDISLTISPVKDGNGNIVGASKIARDIREKKRAEATRELLLNEIKHRVKNTLATVQAMATQTFRTASPQEHKAYTARIHAMAQAHDLLTQRSWQSVTMTEVAERGLRPFCDGREGRVNISGPNIELPPNKALLVGMIIHELGTNAVKYGALSTNEGSVNLSWLESTRSNQRVLDFCWAESGGPTVVPPAQKGFGSRMIERALSAEGGSSSLEFLPDGLICRASLAV